MKSILTGVAAFLLSIFGGHQVATNSAPQTASVAVAVTNTAPIAAPSITAASTTSAISPTTIINEPVIERVIEEASSTVTEDILNARLQSLADNLKSQPTSVVYVAPSVSGPGAPLSVEAFAPSQAIDRLTNTTLNNVTVNGVSGLTAADIPSLSGTYLSVTGGTLTGLLAGTNLALTGNLGVGTSSPSVPFAVDSTSATGTILRVSNSSSGGHMWDLLSTGSANTGGSGRLDIFDKTAGLVRLSIATNGNIGVGTTSPFSAFSVAGSAYLTGSLNVGDAPTTRTNLGLGYASTGSIINNTHIATWGDSLTAATSGNTPYTTPLSQLTGFTVYNGGIGGQTSSQIEARMVADTSKYSWPTVIWAGRNDGCSISTVETNIALMVSALQSVGNTNYLVLGVLNATNEGSGTGAYTCITNLNSYLATTYGSHFIDVRSYLVSQYNPLLSQDVIDHGNDTPPTSLRATGDTLHLSSAGYQDVANYIYQNFSVLQPATSTFTLTPSNVLSLFANPPTIGSTTAGAGYFSRLTAGTTTSQSALTLDAQNSSNGDAIVFSGLPLSVNNILDVRGGPNNFGWKLQSSGGSQDSFIVADGYNSPVFQLFTGSSTAATKSYFNVPYFGIGTTTPTTKLQVSGTGLASNGNPLITFSDLPSQTNNLIGARTAAGNTGWTIQEAGSGGEFFNLLAPSSNSNNIISIYTGSGTFNSFWTPQNTFANFGFGTSSPSARVSIQGSGNTTGKTFLLSNSSGAPTFTVLDNGNVGIGTTSPTTALQVNGVMTPNTDNTSSLGNATYRWASVFAANGTIQTSDARLKNNVTDLNYGLSDLLKLRPVSFTWIAEPQQGTQLGFIAQEVQPIFPETVNVGDDPNHTLGLTYTEFIPVIVKSIQQLAQELSGFAESFISNRITANNELCVGNTCVTPAQFQAMVAAANQATNSNPLPSQGTSTPDATPPVITINGDNPAHITVGSSYNDLGATVTDNVDQNLGYKTFLNGALTSNIIIDTSAAATDTIDYVAIDNAGNTATSTRTIVIDASTSP